MSEFEIETLAILVTILLLAVAFLLFCGIRIRIKMLKTRLAHEADMKRLDLSRKKSGRYCYLNEHKRRQMKSG